MLRQLRKHTQTFCAFDAADFCSKEFVDAISVERIALQKEPAGRSF
jgi:hypothetical protein